MNRTHGFTLIEIVIAIMILSLSLVTLLGLQSSVTDQEIRTRGKTHAMMMARRVMSALETEGTSVEPQEFRGAAADLLKKLLPPPKEEEPSREDSGGEGSSSQLEAEFSIRPWKIKGLPPDVSRRVSLRLSWGQDPRDSLEIIYFIPVEVSNDPEA